MIVFNMASVPWTASETVQLYRRQLNELAVSQHLHKIVVLSGLGLLVSERNNINSSL